jgi:hypothetical protein
MRGANKEGRGERIEILLHREQTLSSMKTRLLKILRKTIPVTRYITKNAV